jgi:hypothetical protein
MYSSTHFVRQNVTRLKATLMCHYFLVTKFGLTKMKNIEREENEIKCIF